MENDNIYKPNTENRSLYGQPRQTIQQPPSGQQRNRTKLRTLLAIAIVSLLVGLGGVGLSAYNLIRLNQQPEQAQVPPDGNFAKLDGTSIDAVVKKVSPSVVSIVSKTKSSSRYSYMLGNEYGQTAGTGMIVSKDGYVLTNKHVIESAVELNVVTDDGTTYSDVKVVTTDPVNDVAFLKISDVTDLKPVEIGNSNTISVGQSVIAIGNALGQFQNTVTAGIISGVGRSLSAQSSDGQAESLTDMIQTDAAINPGNSGGPLVNAAGQVIGINTAVADEAQGIGFVIPINSTKGMLASLIKTGEAKRAFLGVSYITLTPETAKELKLSVNKGAYVYTESGSSVQKDSPADRAGIKDKDIITKINGIEVGPRGSVSNLIAEYPVGTEIEVTLLRDSKEVTVKVTLGEYPE
ncbi:MAG: trypsin-like peptidase domain-containing protein [Candidatus Nomurabacteria bacterium]|jgi:serine protease Do|nr:trypsin-like peptidase domain-containing protein [Candidatus Nomurabacteria bacterium]